MILESCLHDAELVIKRRGQNVRRTEVIGDLVAVLVDLFGGGHVALGIFEVAEGVDEAAWPS